MDEREFDREIWNMVTSVFWGTVMVLVAIQGGVGLLTTLTLLLLGRYSSATFAAIVCVALYFIARFCYRRVRRAMVRGS